MRKVFCTVVSRSHLWTALALAESLRRSANPEVLYILVTDRPTHELPESRGGVRFVALDALGDLVPPLMPYYFEPFELCNALKPYFVYYLMGSCADQVIYMDSDIMVTGSFHNVWNALVNHPILLTPHQLTPPPLHLLHTDEISIVDQGIYNGGFSAWRMCPEIRPVLEWMMERFAIYAFDNRARGMVGDQKLLPLLPVYFPDLVDILRCPSLNIAFWNAHERKVIRKNDTFLIDDVPVVFFHLSGYRPNRPDYVCCYHSPTVNDSLIRCAPWLVEATSVYLDLAGSIETPLDPDEYGYSTYGGLRLTRGLRRLLFRKKHLSKSDPELWRIRLIEQLKRWRQQYFPYRHR